MRALVYTLACISEHVHVRVSPQKKQRGFIDPNSTRRVNSRQDTPNLNHPLTQRLPEGMQCQCWRFH